MNEYTNSTSLFYESLSSFFEKMAEVMPSILGALFILLLGWFIARLISSGISKLLTTLKFDNLADRVNATSMLEKANVSLTPSKLIGRFVYWLLILLVLMSTTDALGWHSITNEVSNLLGYLPKLFIAIVFFVIGTYIASFVRNFIAGAASSIGIGVGKVLSNIVYYFLFILVTLTALKQGGFDTTIITSNLMLIFGTIMVAAAISYGFASRDILSHLLAGYFSRKSFNEGETIEVDGIRGTIVEKTGISITIRVNDNEKVTVPMHKLISQNVRIFD